MRQVKPFLVAAIVLVVLCAVATVSTLADYFGHPEVANDYVPPFVGTPEPSPTDSPLPTAPPLAFSPAPSASPTAAPAAPAAPGPVVDQSHRRSRPTPPAG